MKIITKLLRLILRVTFEFASFGRKEYLKILYPGITIDRASKIERSCKIVCVDGGVLNIKRSFISRGTFLFVNDRGKIEIDNCFIGQNCVVAAMESIKIGSGCAIAEMVVIRDQNHIVDITNSESPFLNYDIAPIIIGKSCWLAAKSTILKGVTIGDNAVVAASAVVNKDIGSYEVWGGVPAKFIKKVN